MIVKKTIDLDMSRRLVNDTIRLHEGDVNGTALVLNVTDNGTPFDLTGCTAKFDAVIGNYLAEADGVATISDSTITVPITPQMTVINGLLKIDVKIIKGGSILFFQTLEMNVQRRVIQGDEQIDLDGTTIGQKLELLDELFKNPPEKRLEVYDNDLDYADKNDTVYVHKVHSGTGSYVKGIVLVAGDDPAYQGCTQYRLRKSGSVEYRTGTLNTTTDPYSYDWSYTATGNWKRLATLDDIPDIPEVVNPWKNKTYLSHGDSITWQDGKDYGSGTHQGETARGYQTVLKELLELGTHTNKGVNGATLADRAGVSVSGVSTIKSIASYASYDLCTIAFGTNDFKQGVPLGTLGAATDTAFDTTTFFGAFREAVKYILTSSPTIRLVLMTPLQRNQHDYSVDTVNAAGLKLIDYVNAVKLIGKMYGLPVCDLYSNSGITELTLSAYTIDGLHPNDEGYKRMGEVLSDTLTSGGNNDAADLDAYLSKYLKNGSYISSQERSKPPLYVRDDVDYGTSFLNKLIESGNTIYYNTGRIADAPAIYRLQWAILNPSPIEVMELPTGGTTYFDASEDKCVYVPYLPGELIKYDQNVFRVNVKVTAKNKDYITYEYLFEEIDYYTKNEIDSMIGDIGTALDTLNNNLAEV